MFRRQEAILRESQIQHLLAWNTPARATGNICYWISQYGLRCLYAHTEYSV